MKNKSYLGFGLAAVIALIAISAFMAGQTHTTSAAGAGPAMSLTVPGGDCADGTCTVAPGADFTIEISIDAAPASGYIAAQSWVDYGSDLVYNNAGAGNEIVWADCEGAVALKAQLSDTAVNHGCLSGLIPPLPVSEYTGLFVTLSFTCSAGDSSTDVALMPAGEAPALTNGAQFTESDTVTQTVPKLTNVTIVCGAGPAPTTPPAATTPPPVTDTPVPPTPTTPPTGLCGDIDLDGDVDSIDSLWILWLTAGLVDEIEGDGDINGDGTVDSRDAALVLQIGANLFSCA